MVDNDLISKDSQVQILYIFTPVLSAILTKILNQGFGNVNLLSQNLCCFDPVPPTINHLTHIAILGGGAAGFFAALSVAEHNADTQIVIYEKNAKLLQKVKVSGGGRCNVTHHCFMPYKLAQNYPRGEKLLAALFKVFQAEDTVNWFENRGVGLKTEQDGRIFPASDSSQTIIDCFIEQAKKYGIKIKLNHSIEKIKLANNQFKLQFANGELATADKVIVATGGYNNAASYQFLADLGHTIVPPVPSLFTFNDSQKQFADLSGIAVASAIVKIAGTKFENRGPLLITHWGLSGPAVIKLSAWAAEYLALQGYVFTALVNWTGIEKEEQLKKELTAFKNIHPKKKIATNQLLDIPLRLWMRICELAEIEESKIWAEMSQKQWNKLIENLYRSPFHIKGKTTFKEEFVICGGVDLNQIDIHTMESKLVKGLHFAGEVLHIDGVTGGFNFQSAWSTGWIAGKNINQS